MPGIKRCAFLMVTLLSLTAWADGPSPSRSPWTGSFTARLEALALLQTLNAELLSHNSATLTLEHWCAVHHLATPPIILAERVRNADKPVTAALRQELKVTPGELLAYRRVRLRCGALVLSEADNWYVPSRLTPQMNQLLNSSDVPFGKVVQALQFQRRALASTVLWSPLPEAWEMSAQTLEQAAGPDMPDNLLEHRALLSLPDGTPFSEVVETYTHNVLAFPVPRTR